MQEKREYHRIKVNVPLTYLVPPQRERGAAETVDVSGTGLLFKTPQELKVRQELLMYLSLNGQTPVEMHAKVVRVEKDPGQPQDYYVGVRIADRLKFDERKYVKFYAGQLKEKSESNG